MAGWPHFKPKRDTVVEALRRTGGNVTAAAKEILKVDPQTLYQYISDNPDIKPTLEHFRELRRERELDNCEDILDYICNLKEKDTTNSLKATIYKLNNLGKNRKYNHAEIVAAEHGRCIADNIKEMLVKQNAPQVSQDDK